MTELFSRKLKDELIQRLQEYFQREMDQDLGNIEVEFLLDFLSDTIGPHYYNQAIKDIQLQLSGYLENIYDKMDELIKPLTD